MAFVYLMKIFQIRDEWALGIMKVRTCDRKQVVLVPSNGLQERSLLNVETLDDVKAKLTDAPWP
jgi:hypothetical protein